MDNPDFWVTVRCLSCGLGALFLLILILGIKWNTRSRHTSMLPKEQPAGKSEARGGDHFDMYEGVEIAQFGNNRTAGQQIADKDNKIFGDFTADAEQRASDSQDVIDRWHWAHDVTVKSGPEVIDNTQSVNNRKEWH